ncbi:hypothetical protein B0O99DRAFT_605140 [Bisporella sp. PMI_857]|nr:hypothetical protein B0O99DRAFT_605140 [Bisporella sp. PMI_857]
MSLCDPHPAQLLHYLPQYKVVVCIRCRYAVQPNAIQRHLKETHGIKRSHRLPFLRYISQLKLNNAETVLDFKVEDFPVPLLPVLQGFKCEHPTCSHLCVTEKRMKNHWLHAHGQSGQANLDWRATPLQSFFRGTLLKYFTKPNFVEYTRHFEPYYSLGEKERKLFLEEHHGNVREDTMLLYPVGAQDFNKPHHKPSILDLPTTLNDDTLLHFYTTSTWSTLADTATAEVWQSTMPQLGQRFPFVMHGILACTALHIAHFRPCHQQDALLLASKHQAIALPLYRAAIENVNVENCDAIYAFAHLLAIYSFASSRQDEELLFVSNKEQNVIPSWLYFMRAGCLILCEVWAQLTEGLMKGLASVWDEPVEEALQETVEDLVLHPLLIYLLSIIPEPTSADVWSEEISQIYRDAALELTRAFSHTQYLGRQFTTWHALRVWPMQLSLAYLNLLSSRHPAALILMAHFCIILKKLECKWYFEGRATSLLNTVMSCLDQKWHHYIKTQLEDFGKQSNMGL